MSFSRDQWEHIQKCYRFSERKMQILKLLFEGTENDKIAQKLKIQYNTVKAHFGNISTNTAESYFALLKRGVHGTFHHISKQHLFRYCDEFSFRWNFRNVNDGERTTQAIQGIEGKRLLLK